MLYMKSRGKVPNDTEHAQHVLYIIILFGQGIGEAKIGTLIPSHF